MAHALDHTSVRPLTADEVIRMVEAGILSEDERVELLHGTLWRKPVKSPEHEWLKGLLADWLRASDSYVVRVEAPLAVPGPHLVARAGRRGRRARRSTGTRIRRTPCSSSRSR